MSLGMCGSRRAQLGGCGKGVLRALRWGQRLGLCVLGLPEACHETRSCVPSLWTSFPQYNTVLEILAGLSSPAGKTNAREFTV